MKLKAAEKLCKASGCVRLFDEAAEKLGKAMEMLANSMKGA